MYNGLMGGHYKCWCGVMRSTTVLSYVSKGRNALYRVWVSRCIRSRQVLIASCNRSVLCRINISRAESILKIWECLVGSWNYSALKTKRTCLSYEIILWMLMTTHVVSAPGISYHNIKLVLGEYSGFSNRRLLASGTFIWCILRVIDI